ncbi:MAG: hypothetical protein WB765_10905 [Acidimicrobiales bacterium]
MTEAEICDPNGSISISFGNQNNSPLQVSGTENVGGGDLQVSPLSGGEKVSVTSQSTIDLALIVRPNQAGGTFARVDMHGELDGSPPAMPGETSDQTCTYWGMIIPSS